MGSICHCKNKEKPVKSTETVHTETENSKNNKGFMKK